MVNLESGTDDPVGRREWAATMHRRIAATLIRARESAGWSSNQLATETSRLGCPVSRSQIARYENGAKVGLDVGELIALAAALGMPPIALLYGGHPDEPVEVLPGKEWPAAEAIGWFCGDETLMKGSVAEPNSPAATLLRLTRERAVLQDSVVTSLLTPIHGADDRAQRRRKSRERIVNEAVEEIAEINSEINELMKRVEE
jgi:transcriptional regulator with XRE-family HTH domain